MFLFKLQKFNSNISIITDNSKIDSDIINNLYVSDNELNDILKSEKFFHINFEAFFHV
jgi:hypothetical protein